MPADTITAINNVIKFYVHKRRDPLMHKKLRYWFEIKHNVRHGRQILKK